jgi:pre-mRNA 3'-end-processing factor FIP1
VPRESVSVAPEQPVFHEGLDPSTLPPAIAPPSHPSINLDIPGILDGHSILEVDISAMAEKPWRLPGADISDWFNYGFDEISWEAYCYRRRDLGELANVLKTNVLVRYIVICLVRIPNSPPLEFRSYARRPANSITS